jgi:PLD-like domain
VPGDQFFLAEADATDDAKFRAPKRPGSTVVPLVDGIPTFKAMEVVIASAKKSVHFAAWTCKSDFPLQAKGDVNKAFKAAWGKEPGVSTWKELFAAVAAKGVEVCILLSDFDAILQSTLHQAAWESYRAFRAAAKTAKATTLQAMCSRHDAHFAPGLFIESFVLSPALTKLVNKLNATDPARGQQRLNDMPGIWLWVKYNKTANKFERAQSSPPLMLWPASHHQKICIVDGKVGFCGGIDPQPGRIDTPAHSGTWHDTHVQVDGPLAADLERNFAARWNAELTVFNTFITNASASGKWLDADPVTAITATPASTTAAGGPATGQLLRTVASTQVSQALPVNQRADIEESIQQAIAQAQSFIYIENQYVRDERLTTWLSGVGQNVVVILVLPIAPEEMAAPGGADKVTLKGVFLQDKIIKTLRTSLAGRFNAYSMVQTKQAQEAHATNSAGSFQVYVHSKTMIVDDQFAMIGSANLNPRSHRVDTEANIAWYEPVGVKALRLALWGEMLGNPAGMSAWTPSQFITKWDKIATDNAATTKQLNRKGFVVPHDTTKFAGADDPDIPKEYTELTDVDPTAEALV